MSYKKNVLFFILFFGMHQGVFTHCSMPVQPLSKPILSVTGRANIWSWTAKKLATLRRTPSTIKNYIVHNPGKAFALGAAACALGGTCWWLYRQTLALNNPIGLSYDLYHLGDPIIKEHSKLPNFGRETFKAGDEGYRGDEENVMKIDYKNFVAPIIFAATPFTQANTINKLAGALEQVQVTQEIEVKSDKNFDQKAFEKFYQDHEWLMSRCPKELQEKFYLYYRDLKEADITDEDMGSNFSKTVIKYRDDPSILTEEPKKIALQKWETKLKNAMHPDTLNKEVLFPHYLQRETLGMQRTLGAFLIKFLAKQEGFDADYRGGNVYITNKKLIHGQRYNTLNKKNMRNDLSIIKETDDALKKHYNETDDDADIDVLKKNTALKKHAATLYKIHLMPKTDQDILSVSKMLMDAIKEDPEYAYLLYEFKIVAKLSPDFDAENKRGADIVIYPAQGKENAQKLLNKLIDLFKGIEGSEITPRYNIKVNSLLYYAQGNADEKSKDYAGEYFDAKTKDNPPGSDEYALYKPTFEDPNNPKNYYLKITG